MAVRQLDFDLLGTAATIYVDDPTTLAYLLRAAQRFRSDDDRGFALVTAEGTPVHFSWVRNFEAFRVLELERTLPAPCADAVMIFDCFTPASARGRGYFAETIGALAEQLNSEGKAPWIFGAATNKASLRGIRKSGFRYKFSLGRKKFLFLKKAKDSVPSPNLANVTSSVQAP